MDVYEQNWELFESGIEVALGINPYDITSIKRLGKFERMLNSHSEEFGEEAVLVHWGQPFGGPTTGYKIHKKSEVITIRQAYKDNGVRGMCPMAGAVYTNEWFAKRQRFLEENGTEWENPDDEYICGDYLEALLKGEI